MENIYQLLSQHDFTIINENIDDFKCAICQNIPINACQGTCGCNFCRNCADARVTAGDMFCPGTTEECQMANLSTVTPDHRMNKQISKMVVKCAEQTCSYECPLKNMDEHLRFCPKKSVVCPFNDVGCDGGTMAGDKLNEHLQTESRRHNEILIDIIGNLRNEMAELTRSVERNNIRIDELEKNDVGKTVLIASMNEKIKSIKLEKASLELRVAELMDILDDKMDKCDMAQQIDIVTSNVLSDGYEQKVNMEAKFDEMKQWRDTLQLAVADIGVWIDTCRMEKTLEINGVENCLAGKIEGGFKCTIDDIENKEKKNVHIYSEYFNGCSDPYKMRLGYYWWSDNEMYIWLRIDAGERDAKLQWPFLRNVTIAITNQSSPNARRTITQCCRIEKPENNSNKKTIYFSRVTSAFIFNPTDLSKDGLLLDNRVTVQCIIHDG